LPRRSGQPFDVRRPLLLVLLLLAVALALAACGGSGGQDKGGTPTARRQLSPASGGAEMSAADVGTVVTASRSLEAACPNAATDVVPDPGAAARTLIAVERRVGPDAIVEYGALPQAMTMRAYLRWEGRQAASCGLRGPAAQLERAAAVA
jgi:hypothetical protein